MLSASGRHAEAETWLRRALEGGNLNFLRSARHGLGSRPTHRSAARRWPTTDARRSWATTPIGGPGTGARTSRSTRLPA